LEILFYSILNNSFVNVFAVGVEDRSDALCMREVDAAFVAFAAWRVDISLTGVSGRNISV